MGAMVARIEERAFQMGAEDVGVGLHQIGDVGDATGQMLDRCRHE